VNTVLKLLPDCPSNTSPVHLCSPICRPSRACGFALYPNGEAGCGVGVTEHRNSVRTGTISHNAGDLARGRSRATDNAGRKRSGASRVPGDEEDRARRPDGTTQGRVSDACAASFFLPGTNGNFCYKFRTMRQSFGEGC